MGCKQGRSSRGHNWEYVDGIHAILCYFYHHHTRCLGSFSPFSSYNPLLIPSRSTYLSEVKRLKNKIRNKRPLTLALYSPYSMVAVVKNFLRKLPDCLMKTSYYDSWILLPKEFWRKEAIFRMQKLIDSLPVRSNLLLKRILLLLNKVKEYSRENRMGSFSLAKYFGCFLLWNLRRPSTSVEFTMNKSVVSLIHFMIDEACIIYQTPDSESDFNESTTSLETLSRKSSKIFCYGEKKISLSQVSESLISKESDSKSDLFFNEVSKKPDNDKKDVVTFENEIMINQNDPCDQNKQSVNSIAKNSKQKVEHVSLHFVPVDTENMCSSNVDHSKKNIRRTKSDRILKKSMDSYFHRRNSDIGHGGRSSHITVTFQTRAQRSTSLTLEVFPQNDYQKSFTKDKGDVLVQNENYIINSDIVEVNTETATISTPDSSVYTCVSSKDVNTPVENFVHTLNNEKEYDNSESSLYSNSVNDADIKVQNIELSNINISLTNCNSSTDLDANCSSSDDDSSENVFSLKTKLQEQSLYISKHCGNCKTCLNKSQESIIRITNPRSSILSELYFPGPNKPQETDL